ncbi:MAG: CapA family protein [Clostridia bacterium]|nr:CapA family protein [Clostridia bacterium]
MKRIQSLLTLLLTLALLTGCTTPAITTTVDTSTLTKPTFVDTTTTQQLPDTTPGTTPATPAGTTAPITTATPEPPPPPPLDVDATVANILTLIGEGETEPVVDATFIRFVYDTFGEAVLLSLQSALEASGYSRDLWYTVTGNTFFVLRDLYAGEAMADNIYLLSTGKPGSENATTTLTFGGDICLADNYLTMEYMKKNGLSITDCIDPLLIAEMQSDDITFMNNEFTISDRGKPMANKAYTFRAATANTALYHTLGVDIVSLANNHAYDYGKDAFLDTLDTLKANGIEAIGGGKNLEEAMTPVYYIVNGRKIAYVAASRAEKYKLTPQATATAPGILRCYDTAKFLQVIREAEANSDFVIACVHWGTEYSDTLQKEQTSTAREYIDAGADLIVGAHAHQLQGVEYYEGKAIFYNLGNFWFNSYEIDTGLLKVELFHDGTTQNTFLPALQKNCTTSWQVCTDRGSSILSWMEAHSIGVRFDENGVVTPKAAE